MAVPDRLLERPLQDRGEGTHVVQTGEVVGIRNLLDLVDRVADVRREHGRDVCNQHYRRHYGEHSEPVCWTQIGYACGYASAFMGRPILFKEVECVGMGNDNCRIIGKPVSITCLITTWWRTSTLAR